MNCPIVFKKATLEDEGEYLRLSKLFYATDAVLSPLPEEFHKNIFKEICRSSAYLEAFLFSFAGEIAGYGLVSKRFSTEAGGLECWVERNRRSISGLCEEALFDKPFPLGSGGRESPGGSAV